VNEKSKAREARDHLGDLTALLGISGPRTDHLGGVVLHLTPAETHRLADALLNGLLARQFGLTPDAPVWCTRHDGVGSVVRVVRHEVTLRSLESGERWDVHLSDIRPATTAEVRAAEMPPARQVTA
jgi:hypothetical protein